MDCRVMQVCYYEALPLFPGSLWSVVMPSPPRLSLAQSVPSSDIIETDKACWITNALQEHALALHKMILAQAVVDPSH